MSEPTKPTDTVEHEESSDIMLAVWLIHNIDHTDYNGQYKYTVFCGCGWSKQYDNALDSKATTIGEHVVDEIKKATKAYYRSLMEEVIGEDEEVQTMEDYVEYRGGYLNIDEDDNPEIEGNARNELRAEQRKRLDEKLGGTK